MELYVGEVLGGDVVVCGERFWIDCVLLVEKGIKVLLWGLEGYGLYVKEEWVDVKSV